MAKDPMREALERADAEIKATLDTPTYLEPRANSHNLVMSMQRLEEIIAVGLGKERK